MGYQATIFLLMLVVFTKSANVSLFQASKMQHSGKIVKSLIIFAKCFVLDVWQGSEYASLRSVIFYGVLRSNNCVHLLKVKRFFT